ncbi:MAG: phosphate acyltransferase PlsX [Anaerolineales bacterium]|nr:phosphate acyltransferase PlsX [Anaerolineales bacterium]
MKIVLDAMGSDNFPSPDVAGGVLAAREYGEEIILVGDESRIQDELGKYDITGLSLTVVHASQVIDMSESPAMAVKSRPDSSVVVGMDLLKKGEADAFVSAGNTGAMLAGGLLRLGRIRGIKRPGLTIPFPLPAGPVILVDIGANVDCRPQYLYQFAMMGSAYAERVMGIDRPRVATLSNGEEAGKGNELVKETAKLLQESPLNYIGNVEPKEFIARAADVVVMDGFTGNIVVKTAEAVSKMLTGMISDEIKSGPITMLGGLLAKPAFSKVKTRLDPFEVGGAVLLGLKGIVIVAHGRSNDVAVKNAIRQAIAAINGDLLGTIQQGLTAYNPKD